MRAGEFEEGAYTLRAKIDMASGNMNLRDPALYRIRKQEHHRTGNDWVIYPMYDFAHPLSDAIEGITHSLCTLEFEDHRPLYDWVVENSEMPCHPQQIEFSRLNLNYTITSKRKLKRLVDEGFVSGWDDPRMPTLRGLRRRGCTADSIKALCEQVGVSKQKSTIDMSLLENCLRDDLNKKAPRRMAVLKPIKVVLTNFDENEEITLSVANHPQNESFGRRELKFTKELYIDQDDFCLEPPPKYFRLAPGKEVRLMNAFVIHCDEVIQDEAGNVTELRCTYLPETLGGKKPDHGKKVKGIVQWVSAKYCVDATVNLYDRLFSEEEPARMEDFTQALNPDSLKVIEGAKLESSLQEAKPGESFQFNRVGYFCADSVEHKEGRLVFNRAVSLRDGWAKKAK
jgi:glutaminyl-tRNA synthetase